ncbi:unnamed protein product [Rotaria sordida]|uniref:Uncharacterized protein n=1 Tax=Rotaria sordida TaxID=392033 RepID=A0A814N8X4_9BILA|nr:unnamed protein product [Rotaria sordida]
MTSFNNDEFRCPLKDGFKILKKDIGSLPLNRAIRDLVESYVSTQRSNLCTNCKLAVAEYKCDTYHRHASKDDVAKELETQINTYLQAIQSALEYRHNQADILINVIDSDCKYSRLKIAEAMTLLREIIDRHEKTVLQQISTIEQEQKKQLEDYKNPLKNELHNLNIQKATFEMLITSNNSTKLLQMNKKFDDYMNKTNATLISFRIPTRTEYHLEGLDQFQILKQKIEQYGRYVEIPPYHNSELEQFIAENRTKQKFDLTGRNLSDLDMKIVADVLKESTTLTSLGLAENQIGQQGAQHIANALRTNQTLTILYLKGNQIGEQGAQHIAYALRTNRTLTELYLAHNQIGEQGAQHIADALKRNRTLTILGLTENRIGYQGAQYIANALRTNQTLTTLDLRENSIEEEEIQWMQQSLKSNKNLTVYW